MFLKLLHENNNRLQDLGLFKRQSCNTLRRNGLMYKQTLKLFKITLQTPREIKM